MSSNSYLDKLKRQMGSSTADESAYKLLKGYLAPWDLSGKPSSNSEISSFMGGANKARLVAIGERINLLLDGLGDGPTTTSVAPFDPHNWVIREHESTGSIIPAFWSLRLIVDHRHPSSEKGQRSTIICDGEADQGWAWTTDLWWLIDLDAKVKDKQLQFDKAGLLPYFTGLNSGSNVRSAAAFNINKSAGYITDGATIGQLWHVLHLSRTVDRQFEQNPAGGGRPTVRWQGSLRGDVCFNVDGCLADLYWGSTGAVGCNSYMGHFAIDARKRSPKPPRPDIRYDAKNGQDILSRLVEDGIRPVVKIRAESSGSTTSCAPPNIVPDGTIGAVPDSGTETSGLPPLSPELPTGTGDMATLPSTMEFATGEFVGISRSANLPVAILDQQYALVRVPVGLDSAATGGTQYDFAMTYMTQYNDPNSAGTWAQLTGSISAADLPTDGFVYQEFEIPTTALTGKGGGMLWANFYQLSSSTGDEPLLVGEPMIYYPTESLDMAGSTVVEGDTEYCTSVSSAPSGYP